MNRSRIAGSQTPLVSFGIALFALVTLSLASGAAAEEQSAARKVGRGFAGLIGGIFEVPGNVIEEARINGPAYGVTVGLARGLGLFVSRELVGAYEIVTSPFELPANFEPILSPEYPWQYFEGTGGDFYDRQARELARIPGARVERRDKAVIVSFPNSLLFETGSTNLSIDSDHRLASLARAMKRYPNTTIAVTGHADSTGEEEINLAISDGRAKSVRHQLLRDGVGSARVTTAAEGEARPVASNATRVGRQMNRRVELRLESMTSGVAAER